jgi:ribosomal protein S18 acetylase RimI-like enzyme
MQSRLGWLGVVWYDHLDPCRLAEIHARCFPDEHWAPEDFKRFANSTCRTNVVRGLVDPGGLAWGTLLYTLTPRGCRLRRLAVWPEEQRRGLGAYLLGTLVWPRGPARGRLFTARVREADAAAQLLLRKLGFAFDPAAPREKAAGGQDYYEFSYQRVAAAAAV